MIAMLVPSSPSYPVRSLVHYLQSSKLTLSAPPAYRMYVISVPAVLIPSSRLPTYGGYEISSDTCRTACSCDLFFAHLQRVHDLIRYLPKSMFMAFSPLPAYRGYVISSDTCRTACSFRLLLGLITEGMRACLIPAEQYGHTFSCWQLVRDLVRYQQKGMFIPYSPLPAYSWYMISSETCRTAYSCHFLLGPAYTRYIISSATCRFACSFHVAGMWCRPIPAEQHAHAASFARLQRVCDDWSRPTPIEQHAHAIIPFARLRVVHDLVRYLQNNMLISDGR